MHPGPTAILGIDIGLPGHSGVMRLKLCAAIPGPGFVAGDKFAPPRGFKSQVRDVTEARL